MSPSTETKDEQNRNEHATGMSKNESFLFYFLHHYGFRHLRLCLKMEGLNIQPFKSYNNIDEAPTPAPIDNKVNLPVLKGLATNS